MPASFLCCDCDSKWSLLLWWSKHFAKDRKECVKNAAAVIVSFYYKQQFTCGKFFVVVVVVGDVQDLFYRVCHDS